jgi:ubiquinone/menaquinone biosynthesis C-methylase UbiE
MPKAVDYDRVAPKYDRRYTDNEWAGVEETLEAFAGAACDVLEVGCETGHWVGFLRSLGLAVTGLDRSQGMLDKAVARLGDHGLVLGRAEALPFEDRSFDRVVVVNAMHHFEDAARFARVAFRVLRPGGRVIVIGLDPSHGDEPWFIYQYFPGNGRARQGAFSEHAADRSLVHGRRFHALFQDDRTSLRQARRRTCVPRQRRADQGIDLAAYTVR